MFAVAISEAQIPNAGFETWTSMGSYNNPDSWSCLNDMTASMSTYTCMKGTPGNPGTSYLKLVSKTVTGMGVMPGVGVSGNIDPVTFQPTSGFAYNQRPTSLTGSFQHMIAGSSQGFIDVQFTYWDNGMNMDMPLASGHLDLTGMAMSWTTFSVPINYLNGNSPDSCRITFSASGSTPTDNDYLYVDNLAFSGVAAGIAENHFDANITLFPNPASEKMTIDLSALNDKKVSLEIFDVQGKQVKTISNINVSSKTVVEVAELTKGNYVLHVITNDGIIKRNFIKQ
jgi:hypothetical protein